MEIKSRRKMMPIGEGPTCANPECRKPITGKNKYCPECKIKAQQKYMSTKLLVELSFIRKIYDQLPIDKQLYIDKLIKRQHKNL